VHQTSLNDSHVSYEINAFTRSAGKMESIVAELHRRIQDEFNKAGVEIMSPSYLSLRDGNAVAMPAADLPAKPAAPAFHVKIDSRDEISSREPSVHDVLHG
jgi:small-conductance mechanosensitive channel